MPDTPIVLTVPSGSQTSSAFALPDASRQWAVFVSSMAGNTVRCQFATASGGTSTSFATYVTFAGNDFLIASGTVQPAVAVIEAPPSPFGRLSLGAATVSTVSATLVPVNRR